MSPPTRRRGPDRPPRTESLSHDTDGHNGSSGGLRQYVDDVPRTPAAAQARRRRLAEREWWLARLAEHNEMYGPPEAGEEATP